MTGTQLFALCLALLGLFPRQEEAVGRQVSESGIRHAFVISGTRTAELTEESRLAWHDEHGSRDASKLGNGNYPVVLGQHALELNPAQEEHWRYAVSAPNTELMGGQRLPTSACKARDVDG